MDDVIAVALKRFADAEEAEAENRAEAKDDFNFYEGDQWPDDVASARKAERRACLTINKIPLYARQIVNDIRQIRPSIKVRPVDSESDPETAEIINGMIRAIEQDSSAESAYDYAAECAVIRGWGYWRILTDYESDDAFNQCIKIKRVRNPFSVYIDPASTEQDASDMRYAFVTETMPREVFKAKYPKADAISFAAGQERQLQEWFGEDYVRVAEYWCVESETVTLSLVVDPMTGQQYTVEGAVEGAVATRTAERKRVIQRIITGNEIIEETEWPGRYIPIVRVLGRESDDEGKLHIKGIVRDLKDSQRMYNYYRSADVERTALYSKAPWIGPKGAFKSQKWNTANIKNHAYLEYDGAVPPFRDPPPEVSTAMVQQLMTAADELKQITGIFDPGLGDRSNEISGIAINARRGESDVSNFDFVDNLGRAMTYAGKVLVDLIPRIYDGVRMQRILKPDGSDELVQLNQPYVDQRGKPRNYQVAIGRYDVAVDIGPGYATQRQEATESMLEVLRAFPQAAQVMGDLVAKNMDWPEADEMAKRLKLLLPPEILAEENPAFKQQMQVKDMTIQQLQQQGQMLMQQMQQMAMELQNKQRELQIKEAEVKRKVAADLMKQEHDMTALELEAMRDLSQAGVAY